MAAQLRNRQNVPWSLCEPVPQRKDRQLQPIPHVELAEEHRQLVLDGLIADVQSLCDFAIAAAVNNQREDVSLARRQLHPESMRHRYFG